MSNTTKGGNCMRDSSTPRAMVHKKILDAAKERPDASIETLAEQIDGATVQLVKRVLDEYGDPASNENNENAEAAGDTASQPQQDDKLSKKDETMDDKHTNGTEPGVDREQTNGTETSKASTKDGAKTVKQNIPTTTESSNTPANSAESTSEDGSAETKDNRTEQRGTTDTITPERIAETTRVGITPGDEDSDSSRATDARRVPDLDDLTEKRVEVLRAIHDSPHATQAELADQLNVSRATVSQRVSAIDGFEWSDRQEYIKSIFDGHEPTSDRNDPSVEQLMTRINSLGDRIDHLEQIITELSDSQSTVLDDPELAATVIRACLDSDTVTEQEEQQIIVKMIEAEQ